MNEVMQDVAIVVGKRHLERLLAVVDRHRSGREAAAAERLGSGLRRAIVVPQALVPPEIVAIGSSVRCRDAETGSEWTVVLSCPEDDDERRGRISVLDPLATALLGAAAGEAVRWTSDDGRTRVVEIAEVGRAGQGTA